MDEPRTAELARLERMLLEMVRPEDYAKIHDDDMCSRDAHGCRCACHLLDAIRAVSRPAVQPERDHERREADNSCALCYEAWPCSGYTAAHLAIKEDASRPAVRDGLREALERFLDTHPCASDGNLCRDQAALRAALAHRGSRDLAVREEAYAADKGSPEAGEA